MFNKDETCLTRRMESVQGVGWEVFSEEDVKCSTRRMKRCSTRKKESVQRRV